MRTTAGGRIRSKAHGHNGADLQSYEGQDHATPTPFDDHHHPSAFLPGLEGYEVHQEGVDLAFLDQVLPGRHLKRWLGAVWL